jgi:16S rRNA (uracil1498-N3)-methyltransferase
MSFYFFVSGKELEKETVFLKDENRQHLKSLRLKEGDEIILSDGAGKAYCARIVKIGPGTAETTIIKELKTNTEPPLTVDLFIAIPKADKMERVVRQAVELGVKNIYPIVTARTIVRIPAGKGREKGGRWQRIAASAAAQCRRSYIPLVNEPLHFEEMLSFLESEKLVIIPYENEKENFILPLLEGFEKQPASVALFTGPEGGISPSEMEKLKKIPQAHPVSLGDRILRAETAPLAVLSIIMFFWGDLGRRWSRCP